MRRYRQIPTTMIATPNRAFSWALNSPTKAFPILISFLDSSYAYHPIVIETTAAALHKLPNGNMIDFGLPSSSPLVFDPENFEFRKKAEESKERSSASLACDKKLRSIAQKSRAVLPMFRIPIKHDCCREFAVRRADMVTKLPKLSHVLGCRSPSSSHTALILQHQESN